MATGKKSSGKICVHGGIHKWSNSEVLQPGYNSMGQAIPKTVPKKKKPTDLYESLLKPTPGSPEDLYGPACVHGWYNCGEGGSCSVCHGGIITGSKMSVEQGVSSTKKPKSASTFDSFVVWGSINVKSKFNPPCKLPAELLRTEPPCSMCWPDHYSVWNNVFGATYGLLFDEPKKKPKQKKQNMDDYAVCMKCGQIHALGGEHTDVCQAKSRDGFQLCDVCRHIHYSERYAAYEPCRW